MNKDNLKTLIERYFDGDTSVKEEKELLATLLSLPDGNKEREEVLAVMGYSAMIPPAKATKNKFWLRYVSAAAIFLLLSLTGVSVFFSGMSGRNNECYAYVNGERVENKTQIRLLMQGQLKEMSEASDEIQRQIREDINDFHDLLEIN